MTICSKGNVTMASFGESLFLLPLAYPLGMGRDGFLPRRDKKTGQMRQNFSRYIKKTSNCPYAPRDQSRVEVERAGFFSSSS